MLEDIRSQLDHSMKLIQNAVEALDEKVAKYENGDIQVINDVKNFIRRLEMANLYTPELDGFITEYLRFYND